jgi:aldehyde dehydrogenase (NAD+)
MGEVKSYEKIFVNGAWVAPKNPGKPIEVTNSATGEVIATVPSGSKEDVEEAVAAAKEAFKSWSQTSVDERVKAVRQLAEGVQRRSDEIARAIAQEVGTPIMLSQMIQVGLPLQTLNSMAELIYEVPVEEKIGNSVVYRQPKGVVAAITPWNYPLHQSMAKIAPALVAGCTVVHKPAGLAPLSAFIFAEVVEEAGLPAGVYNLVSGPGAEIGEALASHPDVDFISFTGSTEVGRRIAELAARTIKRVALELGGKSAAVILPDADLNKAIPGAVFMCMLNSGQTCIAHTRMLVPEDKLGEVEERVANELSGYTLGDPLDPMTRMGPLVSRGQAERVKEYIRIGQEEGARLIAGGTEVEPELSSGYFVKATAFSGVSSRMRIAQEEIFGPVLSIIPYKDEREAIEIANDTIYGLSGAVWSEDTERAVKVARQIRTGQVDINGGMFNALAPFGGFKQSGYGRELGKYGLEEFFELQSLQF